MLRYVLLGATWVFLLVIVLHLWLIRGGDPPIPLIVILAVLSLIPLAARLKIGNWLDFTKRLEHLNTEVSSTKEQIRQVSSQLTSISNLVHIIVTSKQSQQQFNISLATEEAANAFASATVPSAKRLYPPSEVETTGDTSIMRLYFLWAADKALALAIPSLWALRSVKIAFDERRLTKAEETLGEKRTSIIEKLPNLELPLDVKKNKALRGHLRAIQTLYKLREDVDSGSAEPPPPKKGRKLLEAVHMAGTYLAGAVSAVPYGLIEGFGQALGIPRKQNEHEETDKNGHEQA